MLSFDLPFLLFCSKNVDYKDKTDMAIFKGVYKRLTMRGLHKWEGMLSAGLSVWLEQFANGSK